jgi:hypothetical protein
MLKFFLFLLLMISLHRLSFGQDTLPRISVLQLGKKVLVSWYNPYSNVANINIQRSSDSTRNFTTIGSVLNVGMGMNGFTDPKEFLPSDQYYRLFVSFEGGSYIFTGSHRPGIDTVKAILELVKPAIIEEKEKEKEKEEVTVPKKERNIFVPSPHVYTGKDNNVIISLPDASKKKYSIKFYEENGTFLFELKRIPESYLTLDKVNFVHSGLFIFELFDNRLIIERHKFYIPKDGRPMPLLDLQGHEIRNY